MDEQTNSEAERHASWLELFFDLVVVAAVAQVAHLLREHPDWGTVGLAAALYYAIWSVWTSFMLYANVAAEKTRVRSLLLAMFGIAIMAAALPETGHDRGGAFVGAYIFCRLLASQTLQRTGKVMADWPVAQLGAGLTPWIASLWMEPPGRYVMWGVGIALDIVVSVRTGTHKDDVVERFREQERRRKEAQRKRAARGRPGGDRPVFVEVTAADLNVEHLVERLGLFVIIVLGEAVIQVVDAAAGADWGRPLQVTALAGFGLLVSLWWLTLERGEGSVLTLGRVPAVAALPSHYFMTAGIIATAAGLGIVAEHADRPLPMGLRWVLCGGTALYLAVGAAVGLMSGASYRWLFGWAVPAALVPLAMGLFGTHLEADYVVVALLAAVAWRVAYATIAAKRGWATQRTSEE